MTRSKNNDDLIFNDYSKLALLNNLYKITSSTLDLNQLLYLIMDITLNNLNADVGNIILRDNQHSLYSKVVLGLSLNIIDELKYKKSKLIDHVFKLKNPLIIKDYNENYSAPKQLFIKSILCSPLKTKNKNIGAIFLINKNLNNKITNFNQTDADLLKVIINNIVFSIENAQLYQEVLNIKNFNTNIINSIPTGVITTDLLGIITSINDSAKFIFTLDSNFRYDNQNISNVFSNLEDKNKLLKSLKQKENLLNFETILRLKDGSEKILNISISILNDMEKEIIGFIFSIIDISEKKILERQMLRNEQLAALGELSAGIAHEIKNPLTSIKGFSQILPTKLKDESFLLKFSDIVKTEVERLNKFIDDLLQFSKPKGKKWENHDIKTIINNVIDLMKYQIKKKDIILKKSLKPFSKIICDPSQLKQVFINIILNALQSMNNKGTVNVTNKLVIRKSPENLYFEYIAVYISDTGKGIPEDIKSKLFNPFFTTKSKGTGLGLSITHKIISQHKGFIEVFSKPDSGTTFVIYIPTINNWQD